MAGADGAVVFQFAGLTGNYTMDYFSVGADMITYDVVGVIIAFDADGS